MIFQDSLRVSRSAAGFLGPRFWGRPASRGDGRLIWGSWRGAPWGTSGAALGTVGVPRISSLIPLGPPVGPTKSTEQSDRQGVFCCAQRLHLFRHLFGVPWVCSQASHATFESHLSLRHLRAPQHGTSPTRPTRSEPSQALPAPDPAGPGATPAPACPRPAPPSPNQPPARALGPGPRPNPAVKSAERRPLPRNYF